MEISLPNNWMPRPYQLKAWGALESLVKRVVLCWHRRSGKDDCMLHHTACQAMQRTGNYWHMLPMANQARKAIWDAVNPHTGRRRIDEAFPPEIREVTRDNEMFLRFKGGSTWQVGGSDNYEALIGSPPIGIVFSEYAQADPNAWAFTRPILLENNGWAAFISTPRGRNHFHSLLEMARTEPGWYGEVLTVANTGIFTPEQIEQERREIAKERGDDEANNLIQQEYFCSFDAAILGSYYGRLLAQAEAQGRIGAFPYDPRYPVITGWDLGVGDSTAIWFIQQIQSAVRVIDYYEAAGVGADHYARVLKDKPYLYDGHLLPHDAEVREWGANATTRTATLKSLGIKPLKVLPQSSIDDGINAVRVLLPRCYFNNATPDMLRGIECLRQYQKTWDERLRIYSNKPLHDWTSHGADGFRTLAQGLKRIALDDTPSRQRFAHA